MNSMFSFFNKEEKAGALIWPAECKKAGEMELLLPKKLFVSYRSDEMDEGDNVHNWTETVIMKTAGKLVKETSTITYSAHNIAHNTGTTKWEKDISFADLDELIKKSKDPEAEKYKGMNAENWKSYVETPVQYPDSSKYPVMLYGKYLQKNATSAKTDIRWYVLFVDEDQTALLMAEQGLNAIVWNGEKKEIKWEDSYLCSWLNKTFLRAAFSDDEQKALEKVEGKSGKVTLLSKEDVEKYLKGDGAVCATATQYAKNNGAWSYTYSDSAPQYRKCVGNTFWWLKDCGVSRFGFYANAIRWNGGNCDCRPDDKRAVVRPVIRLDLKKAFGKTKADQLCEEYWSEMTVDNKNLFASCGPMAEQLENDIVKMGIPKRFVKKPYILPASYRYDAATGNYKAFELADRYNMMQEVACSKDGEEFRWYILNKIAERWGSEYELENRAKLEMNFPKGAAYDQRPAMWEMAIQVLAKVYDIKGQRMQSYVEQCLSYLRRRGVDWAEINWKFDEDKMKFTGVLFWEEEDFAKNLVHLFDVSMNEAGYGVMQDVRIDKRNGMPYNVLQIMRGGAYQWTEEKYGKPLSYKQVQELAKREGTTESLRYADIDADNWKDGFEIIVED